MTTSTVTRCPACGRPRRDEERWCALCGHLFEGAPATRVPRAEAPPLGVLPVGEEAAVVAEPRVLGLPEPWFFLALGLVTAPVLAATPILRFMGWFLSSLAHEMGHAALAWLCGCPAFPAISIRGHAAAFHQGQVLPLVAVIALALGAWAWRIEPQRVRVPAVVLVVGGYLAIALTPVREVLHLLGGHGGELAFAVVCFWRALTGGFTAHAGERALYGTLGWYLLGANVILTTRLVLSEGARHAYARNGSFGLTNDYIRLADDVFGVPLPLVAAAMTLVALGVLPLAIHLARPRTVP